MPKATDKDCPGCGTSFTIDQILDDETIRPEGMQFEDLEMQWNMFYFTHQTGGCGSTFTVPVTNFLPHINEPVPDSVLSGTDRCERHCIRMDDLSACSQPCFYAPFRRFLLGMLERRKPALRIPSGF